MTFIPEEKKTIKQQCEKCNKLVKNRIQVWHYNYYSKWCIACVLDAEE